MVTPWYTPILQIFQLFGFIYGPLGILGAPKLVNLKLLNLWTLSYATISPEL
jgi:hypothetical protein